MARKTLSPGTRVGRYVIQAEQYQDDSGVTYVGEDHGISHKPLVYIREFFPATLSRRRRNEVTPSRRALKVEFARALSHQADRINRYLDVRKKGIVKGFEKVEENGTVYLVTPWPNGETLQTMQERDGKLSPGFVRSLLDELEPGLQKLGEMGLVHGQIAPDMIRRLDSGELAITHPDRLEYCSGEGPATLADPINTPYLAPEFVSPEAGRIGPWCDVYSLSASFYQLITGVVPVSAQERLEAVAEGRDDPLDMLMLDTFLDDDPALFKALEQGLSLSADARPDSIWSLIKAAEFSAVPAKGESTGATGLSTSYRREFWETNGRLIAALAAIFLIVAVAIPVFLLNDGGNDAPPVLAQNDVTDETGEPADEQVALADAENEATPPSEEVRSEPVQAEPEDELPEIVSAWLAVDQQDPDAVLTFYETVENNPVLRAQVRARWITLESEAWVTARARDTEDAYLTMQDMYGETPPTFARHVDDVDDALARIQAAEADAEEDTSGAETVLAEADTEVLPEDDTSSPEVTEAPPETDATEEDEAGSEVDTEADASTPSEGEEVGDVDTEADAETVPDAADQTEAPEAETESDPVVESDEAAGSEEDTSSEAESDPAPEGETDASSDETAGETEGDVDVTDEGDATTPDADPPEEDTSEADETELAETDTEAAGEVDTDCETCPVMVSAPGLAEVSVSAHEISVAEFGRYLTATNRSAPTGCFTHRIESESIWGYTSDASYAEPGYPVTDASPASCISYDEAVQYTEWLSAESGETYRLLTAEEWTAMAGPPAPGLMACSANMADQSLGAEGLQTPLLNCDDGEPYTSPASGNALSSTYGNIAEWVSDCRDDECNRRVAMGGSWVTGPVQLRGNVEDVFSPNSRSNSLGFRVLRE
ncbi:SUMF1/EgtB/PvdO family nonheme iron enzyme [Ponticaulis koreensis]|uniref:SUMF1/EgtB/PvdO family nonheme iron enzyme n=1 Tax=Ponticaulis koreensis TaxID=1123045 RepID=UPI0003B7943D|nr:SUMF1/EgtB/PvdO family nonheme iron enzyme [Ponticaulis koreensis]